MSELKTSNESLTDPPMTYVTQEDWDKAQTALKEAYAFIRERVPKLSTAGTAILLRDFVRSAIKGPIDE